MGLWGTCNLHLHTFRVICGVSMSDALSALRAAAASLAAAEGRRALLSPLHGYRFVLGPHCGSCRQNATRRSVSVKIRYTIYITDFISDLKVRSR